MSAPSSSTRSALSSLPRLATRARTSENQMSMFTVISVGAISFKMLLPSPRAAFASADPESRQVALGDRLPATGSMIAVTETDRACAGQAWGSEDLDCILAIARDSGVERPVRLADAGFRH